MGYSRNRKRLGYRDQGGASQAQHVAHWEGFTFEGGPWRVVLSGRWGQPQVWAASAAEGKRVLLHAAAIAGYNPSADPTATWEVVEITNGRHPAGKVFGVRQTAYGPQVSKREGPEGFPDYESPA
jgi:hypothetical protein